MKKTYILKSKDTPILRFDIEKNGSEWRRSNSIENISPYKENLNLWPHGLHQYTDIKERNNYFLEKWLHRRRSPYERPNVGYLLGNLVNPYGFLDINMGMSLRDTYWIVPADCEKNYKWKDWSPYTHRLDEEYSRLAMSVSRHLHKPKPSLRITCEPTTAGTMRKCWVNRKGGIYLRKGFKHQAADNRVPPVWEFYAAQVAQALGISHVPHSLISYTNDEGRTEPLCECKCFTSEKVGYAPAIARLEDCCAIDAAGRQWDWDSIYNLDAHKEILSEIFGADFYADMMLLDSIILHQNRHLGNWGYLVDNGTGNYIGPAPLTAHGYSMLITAGDLNRLWEMVRQPDWDGRGRFLTFNEMALFVQERHIPALERMKDFEFVQPQDSSLAITQDSMELITDIIRLKSKKALETAKSKRTASVIRH